ncbi:type II secretion system protein E (GspE) [Desulforamulus putei DSM 12395]|uniref:Type II secretion system protein E (GspE) n=1 Tax=Desulforamulus putei DSM 12395 TaxID=1121429 RepID=A0A1M4UUV6_9FIRM|nr:GspE/PulE family protein [Desulforamulus putei]SHE60380.1 type II secretion system protein E (GspE) [Desulforamulus putei DSM 12395]
MLTITPRKLIGDLLVLTEIDQSLLRYIPEQLIRRHKVFPLQKKGNILTVAMVEPANVVAIDDLRLISGLEIEPVAVEERVIDLAIQQYFEELSSGGGVSDLDTVKPDGDNSEDDAPVIRLVHQIFQRAVEQGASDIHIEPQETKVRVRYRIDGMLRWAMDLPRKISPAIVSRIKIIAELDIAEKRLPQDGRIQFKVNGRQIDIRISTMPTVSGEKVVARILDTSRVKKYTIDQLGFSERNLPRFKDCLRAAYGMLLITGPTGSGKTTTLYAALNELNHEERNISTIEDPVEYRLEGVNQTQVNVKAGMTFAIGLRALLRQDPDIIMVGEIRDKETAEIAVKAGNTGHLVLSTLHTNDALGAVDRLIHMGIEPFQVASSLLGVVAQRLVRRLCPHCKEMYRIESDTPEGIFTGVTPGQEIFSYRPRGCVKCNHIGYRGRIAIQEVLVVSGKIRSLLVERTTADEIKTIAMNEGMLTLKMDGLEKAQRGLTSIQEVMRVTYSDEN